VVFVSAEIPVSKLVFRPAPQVHWSCM
jgi:hypothetical protein